MITCAGLTLRVHRLFNGKIVIEAESAEQLVVFLNDDFYDEPLYEELAAFMKAIFNPSNWDPL